MASGWSRAIGNVRSFVRNAMGGLTGGSSLASWAVAGTLSYFLWIRPSQQFRGEQEGGVGGGIGFFRYVEKRKPIPDPQETGMVYGNKNQAKKSE